MEQEFWAIVSEDGKIVLDISGKPFLWDNEKGAEYGRRNLGGIDKIKKVIVKILG